jgi:hypothetical protein
MKLLIGLVVGSLAISGGLLVRTLQQGTRITELEEALGKSPARPRSSQAQGDENALDQNDLEGRLSRPEARLTQMQVRGVMNRGPAGGAGVGAEGSGPEKIVDAEGQVPEKGNVLEVLESYDPEVRDRLRAVIQEEQDQIREQRWETRNQRWKERTQKEIRDFAAKANLSAAQSAEISTLLDTERDTISGIFQKARQDMSFREAREKVSALREENDAKAKEILDEEQHAPFMEMREESSMGFGAGRGRNRRQRNPN